MKYPSEPVPRKVHKHTRMLVDIFIKFYKAKKKKKKLKITIFLKKNLERKVSIFF